MQNTAKDTPRPYPEWRTHSGDRAEDAAYTFGHDLIRLCRDEALARVQTKASTRSEACAIAGEAVDIALHNVLDLIGGFWPMNAGDANPIEYRLKVVVQNAKREPIEEIDISATDMQIGYWKWRDREFR